MASSIYGHAKYNKNVANNNRKIAYCFTSYSPFTCSSFYVSFVELRTVIFLFHLKNSVPYHLIILPSILLIKKVPNVAIRHWELFSMISSVNYNSSTSPTFIAFPSPVATLFAKASGSCLITGNVL